MPTHKTRQKISDKLRGRKHTAEQSLAKSKRQKGKPKSAEWIAKMTGRKNPLISEKLSGRSKPIVTCPHCQQSGGVSAMGRWHFSNCKSLLDK